MHGGMMGYRYENKLDAENEARFWSVRPRWQKRLFKGAEFLFAALIVVGSITGLVMTGYSLMYQIWHWII
jgi:ribosomal protein S5